MKRTISRRRLTVGMIVALRIAQERSLVVAGCNADRVGRSAIVAASTLRGLERRGLVKITKVGGLAARLTVQGENTITLLNSGSLFLESMAVEGWRGQCPGSK